MGYIAPIRMIQYSDYQKRVEEQSKTHDPMPVKFTPRISLQPKSYLGTTVSANAVFYNNTLRKEMEQAVKDNRFPDQTGKGLYINEYV